MSTATSPTTKAPTQGLSHRVFSNSSALTTANSDDDFEEFDPNDTAALLEERLRAWKHACGYLEDYVAATEKIQKSHAKDYEKVLKTISNPLKEAHHFDPSIQGITGFFETLKADTQGISNLHNETAKSLEQVTAILKQLHSQVKSKQKELTKSAEKGSKAVAKLRAASQKHIEALGQYAAAYDSSAGKVENAQNDPYVLQRAIKHKLYKQVLEENNNRNDLITVQDNFAHFEASIVQTFGRALDLLNQIMSSQAERQKALFANMAHKMQAIPAEYEWLQFVHRYSNVIIDPSVPPRKPEEMVFANEDHRSTQPLIAGTLERKSRALGGLAGFKPAFYAVTPAKFLHQYEDNNNHGKNEPSPDLSLYLPECTVGAVAGAKFNVKGKDVSKGKVGNALQTSHELQFKAHSAEEAAKWWKIIAECAGQKALTSELPSPASTTASPMSPNAPSNVLTSPVEKKGDTAGTAAGTAAAPPTADPTFTSGVTELPPSTKQ